MSGRTGESGPADGIGSGEGAGYGGGDLPGSHHTTQLPEGLQKFFLVVIGLRWPEGSEGALVEMSDAWREFARELDEVIAGLRDAGHAIDRGLDGFTSEMLRNHLASELGPALAELRDTALELASGVRTAAADIQKAKIMLIVMGLIALATFLALLHSLFLSFMAFPYAAAVGVTLRQLLQQLIVRLSQLTFRQIARGAGQILFNAGKYAALGAGTMAGIDWLIQSGQMLSGIREKYDGNSIGHMALGGLIGGAGSGLVTGAGKILSREIRGINGTKVPPYVHGLGNLFHAIGQTGMIAATNPLVFLATGDSEGKAWEGILGSFGPLESSRSTPGPEHHLTTDFPRFELPLDKLDTETAPGTKEGDGSGGPEKKPLVVPDPAAAKAASGDSAGSTPSGNDGVSTERTDHHDSGWDSDSETVVDGTSNGRSDAAFDTESIRSVDSDEATLGSFDSSPSSEGTSGDFSAFGDAGASQGAASGNRAVRHHVVSGENGRSVGTLFTRTTNSSTSIPDGSGLPVTSHGVGDPSTGEAISPSAPQTETDTRADGTTSPSSTRETRSETSASRTPVAVDSEASGTPHRDAVDVPSSARTGSGDGVARTPDLEGRSSEPMSEDSRQTGGFERVARTSNSTSANAVVTSEPESGLARDDGPLRGRSEQSAFAMPEDSRYTRSTPDPAIAPHTTPAPNASQAVSGAAENHGPRSSASEQNPRGAEQQTSRPSTTAPPSRPQTQSSQLPATFREPIAVPERSEGPRAASLASDVVGGEETEALVASEGPDGAAPPEPGDSGTSVPANGFLAPEAWAHLRDTVPVMRHAEQLVLPDDSGRPGGKVVHVRFDLRRFEVEPGRWVSELTVPLDFVRDPRPGAPRIDLHHRREFAERLRDELTGRINQRYRLPDGSQLHVDVDYDTPASATPGWETDPNSNIPVVLFDSSLDTARRPASNQLFLDYRAPVGIQIHEVRHPLGVTDSPTEPGVMGPDAWHDDTFLTEAALREIQVAIDTVSRTSSSVGASATGAADRGSIPMRRGDPADPNPESPRPHHRPPAERLELNPATRRRPFDEPRVGDSVGRPGRGPSPAEAPSPPRQRPVSRLPIISEEPVFREEPVGPETTALPETPVEEHASPPHPPSDSTPSRDGDASASRPPDDTETGGPVSREDGDGGYALLGAAKQDAKARGVGHLMAELRRAISETEEVTGLDAVRRRLENDTKSLWGPEGESFAIKVDGKRFELSVRTEFEIDRETVRDAARADGDVSASRNSERSSTAGEKSVRDRAKALGFFVPLTELGGYVSVEGKATLHRPSVTHETRNDSRSGSSLGVIVPVKTREVDVPVRVSASLFDDEGRVAWRDRVLDTPLHVPMSVPEGMRGKTSPQPVGNTPLPPGTVEDVHVRGGVFDAVAATLPEHAIRVGSAGRAELHQFLSRNAMKKDLPFMAVTPEQAARGEGWVSTGTLVKSANWLKGRFHTTRVIVQKRAIARTVTYLQGTDEATFVHTTTNDTTTVETTSATRSQSLEGWGGALGDLDVLLLGGGPLLGAKFESTREQHLPTKDSTREVRTRRGPATRYVVEYDLEVRQVGKEPIVFEKALDGYWWASSEEARRAGIEPREENSPEQETREGSRTAESEAETYSGEVPPAVLTGARLRVRGAGEHIVSRISTVLRDLGFAENPDEPRERLSRSSEQKLSNDIKTRKTFVDDQLGTGPITVLYENSGRLHNRYVEFTVTPEVVRAELRDLVSPEPPAGTRGSDSSAPSAGVTREHESGSNFVRKKRAALVGFLSGRSYTSGGGWTQIEKLKLKKEVAREHSSVLGTSEKLGREEAPGVLDEDGTVATGPLRHVVGKVRFHITGRQWTENTSFAEEFRSGEIPVAERVDIADNTVTIDFETWIPEHERVIPVLNEPRRTAETPPSGTRLDDVRINHVGPPFKDRLRRAQSRALDGVQTVRADGLEHVTASVKKVVRALLRTDLDAGQLGKIEANFRPDVLLRRATPYGEPLITDVSPPLAKSPDQRVVVAHSAMLLDPELLPHTRWKTAANTAEGTSTVGSGRTWLLKFDNRMGPILVPIMPEAGSSTGSLHGVPGGITVHEFVVGPSEFEGKREESVVVTSTTTSHGPPVKQHLVRATLRTLQAAERLPRESVLVKRPPNSDAPFEPAWKKFGKREPTRVAEQLDLGDVYLWATEDEFRELVTISEREKQRLRSEGEEVQASETTEVGERGTTDEGTRRDPAPSPGKRWWRGLSHVVTPIDLTPAIPELRRGLVTSLGEDRAEKLIPSSPLGTAHDNHAVIRQFLRTVEARLSDVTSGGVGKPLRLENKASGQTYELHIEGRQVGRPRRGDRVPGTLTFTDTVTDVSKRGGRRRTAPVALDNTAYALGRFGDSETPTEHEPGYGVLGGGLVANVSGAGQSRESTSENRAGGKQSASLSGSYVPTEIDFEFTVSIKRGGSVLAGSEQTRTVTVHRAFEDASSANLAEDRIGITGEPRAREPEVTPEELRDWRRAPEHLSLPPRDSYAENVFADPDALAEAAERAVSDAGGTVTAHTRRHLRALLVESTLRSGLHTMFRRGLPLPLPEDIGVDLTLHARPGNRTRLLSASERLTVGGSPESSAGKEQVSTAQSFGGKVAAIAPTAPGVPIWATSPLSVGEVEDSSEGRATSGTPDPRSESRVKRDSSSLNASWLEDLELRFVATPSATRHTVPVVGKEVQLTLKGNATVDVVVDNGAVIRRADRNDRIPREVTEAAGRLAEADRAWTDAWRRWNGARERYELADELRRLTAREPTNADRARIDEIRGLGIESEEHEAAGEALADAERKLRAADRAWRDARDAYEQRIAQARADIVVKSRPDAVLVPETRILARHDNDRQLLPITQRLLDSYRSGAAPRVEVRVFGERDFAEHVLEEFRRKIDLMSRVGTRSTTLDQIVGDRMRVSVLPDEGAPRAEFWIDFGEKVDPFAERRVDSTETSEELTEVSTRERPPEHGPDPDRRTDLAEPTDSGAWTPDPAHEETRPAERDPDIESVPEDDFGRGGADVERPGRRDEAGRTETARQFESTGVRVVEAHLSVRGDGVLVDGDVVSFADFAERFRSSGIEQPGERRTVLVTSSHAEGAARELSRTLGAPVIAAPEQVWRDTDGRLVAGRTRVTETGELLPIVPKEDADRSAWTLYRDGERVRSLGTGDAVEAVRRTTRPLPSILDDESWRHSEQVTAPWFAPDERPLRPEQWEYLRQNAWVRTVDTEIADVKSSSGIVGGKPVLESYRGVVRYELRRIEVEPGRFVQEYTLKYHLRGADGMTPRDFAERERAIRATTRDALSAMNRGYRLPSGDQFHLRVEFVPADEADLIVDVGGRGTDQNHWSGREKPEELAHEFRHNLGVGDESLDGSRVFLARERNSAVRENPGASGERTGAAEAVLLPRHLWLVEKVARDQVMVPDTRLGEHYDGPGRVRHGKVEAEIFEPTRPHPPRPSTSRVVPEMSAWRPGRDATLRDFLRREGIFPEAELAPDRFTELPEQVRRWVRRWGEGMKGEIDPRTERSYTAHRVAALTGWPLNASSVQRWWSRLEEQRELPAEALPRVLSWRPGRDATLRDFLRREGVLSEAELAPDRFTDLPKQVRMWVQNWGEGMKNEIDPHTEKPYSSYKVAALTGWQLNASSVQRWWSSLAAPREPRAEVPPEVVSWRPGEDATLRDFLRREGVLSEAELAPDQFKDLPKKVRTWIQNWVERMKDEIDPHTGSYYTPSAVLELLGWQVTKHLIYVWWGALPERKPMPPEVVAWRPGRNATLRDWLLERTWLSERHFIADEHGRLVEPAESWVQAWAKGLQGALDPETGQPYSWRKVAELSGGLLRSTTPPMWWNAAPENGVPREVLAWRPGEDATLKDFLNRTFDYLRTPLTSTPGEAGPEQVRTWARNWAEGMKGEIDPTFGRAYSSHKVAELSGGLLREKEIRIWWGRVRRRIPVPPEVLAWRPGEDATLKDFLIRTQGLTERELTSGVLEKMPEPAREWVRSWVKALKGERDPETDRPYSPHRASQLSGYLLSHRTIQGLWSSARQREPMSWEPGQEEAGPATAEPGRSADWDDFLATVIETHRDEVSRQMGVPPARLTPEEVRRHLALQLDHHVRRTDFQQRAMVTDAELARLSTALEARGGSVPGLDAALRLLVAREFNLDLDPGDDVGAAPEPAESTPSEPDVDMAESASDGGVSEAEDTGPTPFPGMDDLFPWRDPANPRERVYEPYADSDGHVHPTVRENVAGIRAEIKSPKLLNQLSEEPDDPRIPEMPARQRSRLWRLLEEDVAGEVKRLVLGESAPPRLRVDRLEQHHLKAHEEALLGKWGVFLADVDLPDDQRREQRMSVTNGKILGLYLGAVLENREDRESWSERYPSYPDYSMQVPKFRKPRRWMAAEAVGNSTAFANTGLQSDIENPQYDQSAINAVFVAFRVRMPRKDGSWEWEPIVALVALENAYDLDANPHGMITVDYGDEYLEIFEEKFGGEAEE